MSISHYKLTVEKLDFGTCLHTALKKACDSVPTSLAYNLIHLDDINEAWSKYLDQLWCEINLLVVLEGEHKGTITRIQLIGAGWMAAENALEPGRADFNCLRLVFEEFELSDWLGMLAFAVEEVDDNADS